MKLAQHNTHTHSARYAEPSTECKLYFGSRVVAVLLVADLWVQDLHVCMYGVVCVHQRVYLRNKDSPLASSKLWQDKYWCFLSITCRSKGPPPNTSFLLKMNVLQTRAKRSLVFHPEVQHPHFVPYFSVCKQYTTILSENITAFQIRQCVTAGCVQFH